MCGRYTLTAGQQAMLGDRFRCASVPAEALGRWNVAPTEAMAVVLVPSAEAAADRGVRDGDRVCEPARWGLLPRYARDLKVRPQPINARTESVASNKLFSGRLAKGRGGRCLVLADGYYEWLRSEDEKKTRKQPFRYTVDGGAPFAFAGLTATNRFGGGHEDAVRSATILTCPANALAAQVHDRMPVILPGPEEEAAWLSEDLSPEDALELCLPLDPGRMEAVPVSTRVNKAGTGDEGPWLLEVEDDVPPNTDDPPTLF